MVVSQQPGLTRQKGKAEMMTESEYVASIAHALAARWGWGEATEMIVRHALSSAWWQGHDAGMTEMADALRPVAVRP